MIQNTLGKKPLFKALLTALTAIAILIAVPASTAQTRKMGGEVKVQKTKTTEQKVRQQQPVRQQRYTRTQTQRQHTRTYTGATNTTATQHVEPAAPVVKQDRSAEAQQYYDNAIASNNEYEAVSLLKKAAELGNRDAQAMLGRCYFEGIGCSKDYSEALKWFEMAEQRGSGLAYNYIGLCYEQGIKKLTAGSTATPGQAAFMYYQKAAEKGSAEGMANMGRCFLDSIGVTNVSQLEAGRWLRKAALQGNEYALKRIQEIEKGYQHSLERAVSYHREAVSDIEANKVEDAADALEFAYGFYKMAAIQGDDDAQAIIGRWTIQGIGIEPNQEDGMEWIELAADQENTYALNFLGECYESGEAGKHVDKDQAFLYYTRAVDADSENEDAAYNLARCYQKGIGTDVDREMAIQLFQQAMANGNENAKAQLKAMGAGY